MTRQFRPLEVVDNSPGLLRILPSNVEAERALIGAMLLNNRAYESVADFLMPEHFTEAVNGRIFAAMAVLIDRNEQANPVTLKTYLQNDDLVRAAGGIKYLASLSHSMVTLINCGDYGRFIYDLYRRRAAIVFGEDLINAAYDAAPDVLVTDMLEGTISDLIDLNEPVGVKAVQGIGDAVDEVLADHQAIDNGDIAGVSSGIQAIDDQTGLMQDSDLIILGGSPSQGKSALLSAISLNMARTFKAQSEVEKTKPKWVLIMSGEMSRKQWMARVVTGMTGIPGPRQRSGKTKLMENEWAALNSARAELATLPLLIDDSPAPTLSRVLSRARQLRRKGGVGFIGVDYLQLMGVEKSRRQDNRATEIGFLARGLKNLAKLLECPLMALSQITRGVANRENKRPTMADLRESGDIEAAADTVIMLFREFVYLEKTKPTKSADIMEWQSKLERLRTVAEAIVDKARHGATGTVFLHFEGLLTLFSDPVQKAGRQPELGLE